MQIKKWALIVLLLVAAWRIAASPASSKLMINGYDPVAYFDIGKPVPGLKEFEYQEAGRIWRFSSREHLELFKKEPEKYAPQYGGFCAYAVSQNYTVAVDPEAWDIVAGKLYLNYSKSVREKWRKKRDEYIASADKNWPKLKAQAEK